MLQYPHRQMMIYQKKPITYVETPAKTKFPPRPSQSTKTSVCKTITAPQGCSQEPRRRNSFGSKPAKASFDLLSQYRKERSSPDSMVQWQHCRPECWEAWGPEFNSRPGRVGVRFLYKLGQALKTFISYSLLSVAQLLGEIALKSFIFISYHRSCYLCHLHIQKALHHTCLSHP